MFVYVDMQLFTYLLDVEESGMPACCCGTDSSIVDSVWSGCKRFSSDYSTHYVLPTGNMTVMLQLSPAFTNHLCDPGKAIGQVYL